MVNIILFLNQNGIKDIPENIHIEIIKINQLCRIEFL